MDNSNFILSTVIEKLRYDINFDGMVEAKIEGNYFTAADIAIPKP